MDEVDRHPAAILKEVLVIAKASFTVFITLQAAFQWRKHNDRMAKPAQFFLMFNALIVALVTVYKFTSKMVAPLFVLQALSHYSCFLVFVVLWTYGDHERLNAQRAKHSSKIFLMHVAYWVVIALGYKLCTCSEDSVYPISFVMGDGLFFLTYSLLHKLKAAGLDFDEKATDKSLL